MAKLLLEEEEQVTRLFTLLSVGNMSIFFANHVSQRAALLVRVLLDRH